MESIFEFLRFSRTALKGVRYQPTGPKFICEVEGDPLRNFPQIYNSGKFPQAISHSFRVRPTWYCINARR